MPNRSLHDAAQLPSSGVHARRWAAREHTELAPELKITFTPPPGSAPPELIDAYFELESGDLAVEFRSEAGAVYTLETRSDLNSGDWVENLTALEYNHMKWKLYVHRNKKSHLTPQHEGEYEDDLLQDLLSAYDNLPGLPT